MRMPLSTTNKSLLILALALCTGGAIYLHRSYRVPSIAPTLAPPAPPLPSYDDLRTPSLEVEPSSLTATPTRQLAPLPESPAPESPTGTQAERFPTVILDGVDLNSVDIDALDAGQVHHWINQIAEMQRELKIEALKRLPTDYSYIPHNDFVQSGMEGGMQISYTFNGLENEPRHVLVDEATNPMVYALRNAGMKLIQTPSYQEYITKKREDLHIMVNEHFPGLNTTAVESEDGAIYSLWGTVNGKYKIVGAVGLSLAD